MALNDSRSRTYAWTSWCVVALLGAIDTLYGRTEYLGDWISYLNVSRAVSAFDLKAIFDPMWNPGYPILVALFRAVFPHTLNGEWYAIALLNWLIFLGFYAAWRLLLRGIIRFSRPELAGAENHPAIVAVTLAIFLVYGLCFDSVARVAPDMLVTTLFVAASALVLRLMEQPSPRSAALLGLTLGAGVWIKGVFLVFSAIFLIALALGLQWRRLSWRWFGVAALVLAAIVAPFAAGTSLAWGHFTLGVTGSLNYEFHVNNIPHNTNWQGGPPEFGAPLHPTRRLIADLPVFGFAEPFHTTYPPYNNIAYWYAGYRHFFSLKNQAWAIVANLVLLRVLAKDPFIYAVVLVGLAVLLNRNWRESLRKIPHPAWILFLPPALGFLTYLLVHIEARYLSPFLLVGSLFPLLPLLDAQLKSRRALLTLLLVCYSTLATAELVHTNGATVKAMLHRASFHNNEQWKISDAMPGLGLPPGSRVALINNDQTSIRCSWAYTSQIRIVAQFGGAPELDPSGQLLLRHPSTPAWTEIDYAAIYRQLPAARRSEVLDAFRSAGAQAVLAYQRPADEFLPGWRPIPGTQAWIYLFSN
jgi:hypothetical protein